MNKDAIEDGIFIYHCMQFYSYEDFNANFKDIKRYYDTLSYYGKKIYSWYVHQKPMSYKKKVLMWNRLNNVV